MVAGGEQVEFDIICVGSGIGGCAAAIAARAAGLTALIVEKAPVLGGVTAFSGGQVWVPGNRYAAAEGINDTVDEGIAHAIHMSGGWGNEDRIRRLLGTANDALDFFEERGVALKLIPNLPDYYFPVAPHSRFSGRYLEPQDFDTEQLGDWAPRLRRASMPVGEGVLGKAQLTQQADRMVVRGEALAGQFIRAAIEAGAAIWPESPAVELIADGDAVAGVVVRTPEGEKRVTARRGVVLATGAYDWNKELIAKFEGPFSDHGSISPEGIDGDHFRLAGDLGGAITSLPPQRNVMVVGFPQPGGAGGYMMYAPTGPHEIVVNQRGKRFANESFYPALQAAIDAFDGSTHSYPNWPAWLIFDGNFDHVSARVYQPGPDRATCIVADSLEELAAKTGIDPAGLVATVARYNAQSAEGRDDDFRRGEVPWVSATQPLDGDTNAPIPIFGGLSKGPYYAAKLSRLHVGILSAGLEIDENSQVLDTAGQPIAGLYAAGNAAGRNDVGFSLQSGVANLRGMMHGYFAAQHMSEAALESAE